MSSFGGKVVFFLGTFLILFLLCKIKVITSGKIFDLINVFGETETPKGQRICKFLVLSEGKLSVHLELD